MKVKELIAALQQYDDNLVVTTNDNHGGYQDVKEVGIQKWTERGDSDCEHQSVTLYIDGYDPTLTRVKYIKED